MLDFSGPSRIRLFRRYISVQQCILDFRREYGWIDEACKIMDAACSVALRV